MEYKWWPYIITTLCIIALYASIIGLVSERLGKSSFIPNGIRLVRDDYDRTIYFERSAWFRSHSAPYTDVFIEYPHEAAYYFILPRLFTHTSASYSYLHSAFMALVYVLLVYVFVSIGKTLQTPPWALIGLIFPAFLYFSLNRFDVLPATISLLSFWALLRKKYVPTFFLLALAVGLKLYPIVLLPIYSAYLYKEQNLRWKHLITFFSTIVLSAIPILLLSGPKALIIPYIWQSARYFNIDALPTLIQTLLPGQLPTQILKKIFIILQLSTLILSGGLLLNQKSSEHPISRKTLITLCGLSILLFTCFSVFYSPQWIIWWMPFTLLMVKKPKHLILLGIVDLLHYIQYPIGYALLDANHPLLFTVINLAKWISLAAVAVFITTQAIQPEKNDLHTNTNLQ